MKKERNRKLKDYSRYNEFEKEYYGIFIKNDKLRIDVKRLSILKDEQPFPIELLEKVNSMPRNTAYFFPKMKKRNEYTINIFVDAIHEIKTIWLKDLCHAIDGLTTPEKAGDLAYGSNVSDGIMDPEECLSVRSRVTRQRTASYDRAIQMIYAQFIHLMASIIEHAQIMAFESVGLKFVYLNRKILKKKLKEQYDGLEIKTVENYQEYDKFYALWNFLKHNSKSSYKNLKTTYPEILINDEFKGGYSLNYVRLSEELIFELLSRLELFFNSLCTDVFKEDIKEAEWNYDDYFIEQINCYIEGIENPLSLPPYI